MSNLNYKKITSNTPVGYGHREICITYYGKQYCAVTTNMPATDLLQTKEFGWKTAADNLYDEVKRKNNLK